MWVEVGKDSQMCPWLHVIGKRDDKPMSDAAALHLVRNQIYVHNYHGPYAYCSLDKGVAYKEGGYISPVSALFKNPCRTLLLDMLT